MEEAIHGGGLDELRALVIRASGGVVVDRDQLTEAMRRVGKALPKARWELEWALAYPASSTPEIDAALRDDWDHVINEIRRTEVARQLHLLRVLAKHHGKSDTGSDQEAEMRVAEDVRRIRDAVREAPSKELVERARGTKRGFQLRLVELALREPRVHACLWLLGDLRLEVDSCGPPLTRARVESALKTAEPAVLQARHLYEKAMREPELSDRETDAALEPLWDKLVRDLEWADQDIEAGKAWLASNG